MNNTTSTPRRFRSLRGRPPSSIPRDTDLGTPELVMKRALAQTAEAIDLCLQRQIITETHHWCGVHLRWLHTIRYGAPGVTALDLTRIDGFELYEDDHPDWRRLREKEYHEAIDELRHQRLDRLIVSCCIYNERPAFLNRARWEKAYNNPAIRQQTYRDMQRFVDGLDRLAKLWGKSDKR